MNANDNAPSKPLAKQSSNESSNRTAGSKRPISSISDESTSQDQTDNQSINRPKKRRKKSKSKRPAQQSTSQSTKSSSDQPHSQSADRRTDHSQYPNRLTVLSYNIWDEDVKVKERMIAVSEIVKESQADVVLLQEVTSKSLTHLLPALQHCGYELIYSALDPSMDRSRGDIPSKAADLPITLSVEQSINQTTSQSTNQVLSSTITESIRQSLDVSLSDTTARSINGTYARPVRPFGEAIFRRQDSLWKHHGEVQRVAFESPRMRELCMIEFRLNEQPPSNESVSQTTNTATQHCPAQSNNPSIKESGNCSRVLIATSHLESMQQNSKLRLAQLHQTFDLMRSNGLPFIFGGDTNLKGGDTQTIQLPADISDVWVELGSDRTHEHTWDTSKNHNLEKIKYSKKVRFDRYYSHKARAKALSFETVGKETFDGRLYPSDHWGIWPHFR